MFGRVSQASVDAVPKSRNFRERSWEVEFTEKLSGIVERLIDEFGAPAVDAALKRTTRLPPVLPKSLHEGSGWSNPTSGRTSGRDHGIEGPQGIAKASTQGRRPTGSRPDRGSGRRTPRPQLSKDCPTIRLRHGAGLPSRQASGVRRPRGSASPAFKRPPK